MDNLLLDNLLILSNVKYGLGSKTYTEGYGRYYHPNNNQGFNKHLTNTNLLYTQFKPSCYNTFLVVFGSEGLHI